MLEYPLWIPPLCSGDWITDTVRINNLSTPTQSSRAKVGTNWHQHQSQDPSILWLMHSHHIAPSRNFVLSGRVHCEITEYFNCAMQDSTENICFANVPEKNRIIRNIDKILNILIKTSENCIRYRVISY